jgi:hypothetical protein
MRLEWIKNIYIAILEQIACHAAATSSTASQLIIKKTDCFTVYFEFAIIFVANQRHAYVKCKHTEIWPPWKLFSLFFMCFASHIVLFKLANNELF